MKEIKTSGLVLTAVNLNDNDKIFTIQTKDCGKVTAISKGIRSHKHKDFASLQTFCYSEMVLSQRGGLYYVSSAEVINNFYGIRESVEQMAFAAYFTDVVKSFPEELPLEDDYFSFVLNTLYLTSKAQQKCKNGDVMGYLLRLKAVFELKTVCFAGFMPNLSSCSICGTKKDLEYFDTSEGTLVCKNCHAHSAGDLVKLTPRALSQLEFIVGADYKSVFAYGGAENDVDTVSKIAQEYMIHSMEIFPPALTYLKSIISGNK